MQNKLKIQEFIECHSDWESRLQEKPYCIGISRDTVFGRRLIMFKYNQIDSDFNSELVRECRGLILDEDTLEPVCIPFFKFGNYGETYCPKIDWTSCYVTEKLDGSLVKVVRLGDDLLISTNGTIDAFKAPLAGQIGCKARNFGELIVEAVCNNSNFTSKHTHTVSVKNWFEHPDCKYAIEKFKDIFKEGYTYMFELTSPFNRVVVTWHETRLNFIGCRDNLTGKEIFFGDHELSKLFNTPKVFPLHSIDECVKAAAELDFNAEGYVIVDKNFNRVKVKSPTYVALHHMRNNGVLSFERGIEIVRNNELGEVLTYFPEFAEHLNKIKEDFDALVDSLRKSETALRKWLDETGYSKRHWLIETGGINRKDAAIWIHKNFKIPGVGFALIDAKVKDVNEWIAAVSSSKFVKILDYKD